MQALVGKEVSESRARGPQVRHASRLGWRTPARSGETPKWLVRLLWGLILALSLALAGSLASAFALS